MSDQSLNSELLNSLKKVECQDATYGAQNPSLVFERAQGSFIFDVAGQKYLDLCAGFGALPFGHNPEFLKNFLKANFASDLALIMHGMGDVYPSASKIKLLQKLQGMLPGHLTKGALAISGGQAVEYALKTAMLHTKKFGFVVFDDGYHGLDLGVLPTTARLDFRVPFEGWWENRSFNILRVPYGIDPDDLKTKIKEYFPNNFAGILVEPIQGRAGIRQPPSGWLAGLKKLSENFGGLLIFDEILVGFGRTGRDFFCREVEADIVCLGKALGGGMPLSACFGRAEVMDSWPESTGEAIHTGTFFGHPLSCEIAYLNLCEMEDSKIFSKVRANGEKVKSVLLEYFDEDPHFETILGEGLMLGIQFSKVGYAAELMDILRERGIIVLPSGKTGRVLSLTPALNFEPEILAEKFEAIR